MKRSIDSCKDSPILFNNVISLQSQRSTSRLGEVSGGRTDQADTNHRHLNTGSRTLGISNPDEPRGVVRFPAASAIGKNTVMDEGRLRAVFQALAEREVEYAVFGAVALGLHGG